MNSRPEQEVRDAVVKLEAKMEQMSGAVETMAASVERLADIKYELREVRKESDTNYQRCKEKQALIDQKQKEMKDSTDNAWKKLRELEDLSNRNSWFVSNAERLGWIVITGAVGFIWYIVKELGH